jgi:hypothetical protein
MKDVHVEIVPASREVFNTTFPSLGKGHAGVLIPIPVSFSANL